MALLDRKIKGVPVSWLLLALILFGALMLRYEGVLWPRNLHLDEWKIGKWLGYFSEHGELDHVYPSGFFRLAMPAYGAVKSMVGARNAWRVWTGGATLFDDPLVNNVVFAREFNVWLGVVTCIFMYLLARRVTGADGPALLAAALCAFCQLNVEHCHYAETDIAMLLALTAGCWIWSGLIAFRGDAGKPANGDRVLPALFLFAAGSLVSGFAAGTKYLLLIMVLFVPLCADTVAAMRRPRLPSRVLHAVLFSFLGLLVFAVGFLWATPAAWDFGWFVEKLRAGAESVYTETVINLGPAYGDSRALWLLNLRQLQEFGLSLGPGWLALFFLGLVSVFRKRWRPYWPVLLVFPLIYLYYFVFRSPWVRAQECMNFLPAICVISVLPFAVSPGAGGFSRLFRKVLLGVAVVALLGAFLNSVRMAGVFGWSDPRFMASNWLRRHAPADGIIGGEIYTQPASRTLLNTDVYKVEVSGLDYLLRSGCDLVVRNASMKGRGIFDPRTGERFPEYAESFEQFQNASVLLREWGLLEGLQVEPTFIGHDILLYGLGRVPVDVDLDMCLSRPLYLSEKGRETYCPRGNFLGSMTGVRFRDNPRSVAVGGPGCLENPVFLILNTDERSARVRVAGFAHREIVDLSAYDTEIIPLDRPWFAPRFLDVEKITVSADSRVNVQYIPCYMRVAFTAAEAAQVCSQLGHHKKAWEFLRQYSDGVSPYDMFLHAARAGDYAAASAYLDDVLAEIQRLKQVLSNRETVLGLHGVPETQYDRFARVRMQPPGEVDTMRGEPIENSDGDVVSFEARIEPSVLLPEGNYELCLRLGLESYRGHRMDGTEMVNIQCGDGTLLFEGTSKELFESRGFVVPISAQLEKASVIEVSMDIPFLLAWSNSELRWSLRSAVESRMNSLVAATAGCMLNSGNGEGAMDILGVADESAWNSLELDVLRLDALQRCGMEDAVKVTAERILDVAPLNRDALQALAGNELDKMLVAKGAPFVFDPFLRLVWFSMDAEKRNLKAVFEARTDCTPPLAVRLWLRRSGTGRLRDGGWRERTRIPLASGRELRLGEWITLEVELGPEFGDVLDRDSIAIGIEPDVEWHPGALAIRGSDETRAFVW